MARAAAAAGSHREGSISDLRCSLLRELSPYDSLAWQSMTADEATLAAVLAPRADGVRGSRAPPASLSWLSGKSRKHNCVFAEPAG